MILLAVALEVNGNGIDDEDDVDDEPITFDDDEPPIEFVEPVSEARQTGVPVIIPELGLPYI